MEKKFVKECIPRGVLIKDDSVLLVNTINEPHHFLLGGRLEQGESLHNGLKREILEELNKKCRIRQYLGAIEHSFEDETKIQYEVSHFFVVDIPEMDPKQEPKSPEPELKFRWAKISELDKLDIRPPSLRELLKKHFSGETKPFFATTIKD